MTCVECNSGIDERDMVLNLYLFVFHVFRGGVSLFFARGRHISLEEWENKKM